MHRTRPPPAPMCTPSTALVVAAAPRPFGVTHHGMERTAKGPARAAVGPRGHGRRVHRCRAGSIVAQIRSQAAGAFWMFAVLSSALPGTSEGSSRRGKAATGAAKEDLHLPGLQPGFERSTAGQSSRRRTPRCLRVRLG